ncbi:MAG: PEP-CTERM sorting domain-containing protein [Candidatus Binatia bacterium]
MNKKNKPNGAAIALLFLLIVSAAPAFAVTWYEVGDAGNTPGTAQTPIGTGALNTIVGNLYPALDTDVFKIYIPDPNIFAITMNGTSLSADNDTELYVLDATGRLVFNNDDGGPGYLSQVNSGDLAGNSAGNYLIAYNLFSSVPLNDQLNPILGWDVKPKPFQTGTVQLNLTGAEFAQSEIPQPVPEPASVLLMGVGLAGIVRKFRHKFI